MNKNIQLNVFNLTTQKINIATKIFPASKIIGLWKFYHQKVLSILPAQKRSTEGQLGQISSPTCAKKLCVFVNAINNEKSIDSNKNV